MQKLVGVYIFLNILIKMRMVLLKENNNNTGELTAIIKAYEAFEDEINNNTPITIYVILFTL